MITVRVLLQLMISSVVNWRFAGVNPNADSPFENLHSYLIGLDKYIMFDTSKPWDKKKDELFAIHLQSSSMDGVTNCDH
jgi:hypothetical protein